MQNHMTDHIFRRKPWQEVNGVMMSANHKQVRVQVTVPGMYVHAYSMYVNLKSSGDSYPGLKNTN